MKLQFLLQAAMALVLALACNAAISLNTSDAQPTQDDTTQTLAQQALTNGGAAAAANQAFSEGRFAEAIKLAEPLAKQGDADALFLLGLAHETGSGVARSRDKAIEYYRKAFAAGHQDARYRTSLILLASSEESEREDARKMLESAAKTDPAVAGRILGEAWLRGRLSEKPDPVKAAEWWQSAANAGDLASMRILASLYEGQLGHPEMKDPKKALELLRQAASLGDAASMVSLGSRLLMGEKSLRDEKRGREWLEKAIAKGDFRACLVLGDYEENVKKNDKAALAAYERGKDGGQVDCMLRAAEFYLQGRATEKDEARGKALMVKAAESGHPEAQFRIAMSLLAAKEPDLGTAYLQLLSAANNNLTTAQNELALFYLSGKMGVADQVAAIGWLTRAAKLGDAAAQNNLAALYEAGAAGLNQDYTNAVELYSLAASRGHPEATLALVRLFSEGPIEIDLPRAWALASIAAERKIEGAAKLQADIGERLDKAGKEQAQKLLAEIKKVPESGQ